MWSPRDVQEIEVALAGRRLEETHTFDGKALPGRNKDIAIDACAMTIDGGSLLYGVGEDTGTMSGNAAETRMRFGRDG